MTKCVDGIACYYSNGCRMVGGGGRGAANGAYYKTKLPFSNERAHYSLRPQSNLSCPELSLQSEDTK